MSRPQFTDTRELALTTEHGETLTCEPTEHGFIIEVDENNDIGDKASFTIGSDGIDALRAWCEAVLDATKAKGAT